MIQTAFLCVSSLRQTEPRFARWITRDVSIDLNLAKNRKILNTPLVMLHDCIIPPPLLLQILYNPSIRYSPPPPHPFLPKKVGLSLHRSAFVRTQRRLHIAGQFAIHQPVSAPSWAGPAVPVHPDCLGHPFPPGPARHGCRTGATARTLSFPLSVGPHRWVNGH